MTFNIYNILIIAGIIQGFIFTAIVPFAKKYHSKSTFFLVALIFCYSVGNLMYILPDIGVIPLLDMYAYLYLPIAAIDAPIIYYYVIYFLYPNKKLNRIEKLLFLPFILFLALTLFFRLKIIWGNDTANPLNHYFVQLILFTEIFSVIFSMVLLIILISKTVRFDKEIKIYSRNIIQNDVRWLKMILSFILVFVILWLYLTIKNIFFNHGETIFYSLWLGTAVLIYWLGHVGIYKYGLIKNRNDIRDYIVKNPIEVEPSSQKNKHIQNLEYLIKNEKAYLDPKLSLESISKKMNLSPSYLSRIIHTELNISFTDYLHHFRIEEAKVYLSKKEFYDYSITSIGLEAGFNSRSSFFEVFKNSTGKTPLEYKKDKLSD